MHRERGVGVTEAFVLFQQVIDLGVPVWVRGGIGLHPAAAVAALRVLVPMPEEA